jgi:hypothetical protein
MDECKKMIFNVGIKLGVSPNLIATRLLSDLDKSDMLAGLINIVELEAHVEVWEGNGMPDYAHGLTETYEAEKKRLYQQSILRKNSEDSERVYRKPFVEYTASKD